MPHETHSVEIFVACCSAVLRSVAMTPRSTNDKEYFPQDWLIDRLKTSGSRISSRVATATRTSGWAARMAASRGHRGQVARLGAGSTRAQRHRLQQHDPSGEKLGRDVFLAFFLYTGSGAAGRSTRLDRARRPHQRRPCGGGRAQNVAIHEFGSYADGFIRNRKMYVFPHPFALDEGSVGHCRLIVPARWAIQDSAPQAGRRAQRRWPTATSKLPHRAPGAGRGCGRPVPIRTPAVSI